MICIQKTLLEIEPQKESIEDFQIRVNGQKAYILDLLESMDRVPISMMRGQYNTRILELNKDLIKLNPPMEIISEYDPGEKEYYKRLEVIKLDN